MLKFFTSTMSGGKTTLLLQTAYSWKQRGKHVVLIKPFKDTRDETIHSRIGASLDVDFKLKTIDSIIEAIEKNVIIKPDLILVDEAQFLTVKQVEDLFTYAMLENVEIYCYGLKSDFRGHSFPGSSRLLELAVINELEVMICRCGQPARFNARFNPKTGKIITDGPKTLIEGSHVDVVYDSLCGKCFIQLGGFVSKI